MVIPVFRGSKDEDPEVFLREYKRACIGTGFGTAANGLISFLNFWTVQHHIDLSDKQKQWRDHEMTYLRP